MTQSAVLDTRAAVPGSRDPARRTSPRGSWLARHPAWPVTACWPGSRCGGRWAWATTSSSCWPSRWPPGCTPGARKATAASGSRPDSGYGCCSCSCVLLGAAVLSATAPGTLASPVSNRIISYGVRTAGYLGDTALLLFVGNLTEREFPGKRLAWLLGLVALYTIAGGLAGGLLRPSFTSPPRSPRSSRSGCRPTTRSCTSQLHPALSQLQAVLGPAGRPTPPSPTPTSGVIAWPSCCPG